MLALFPAGFEEAERAGAVELAAYTDTDGEARMTAVFGTVSARVVPADWEERWKRFHRPVRAGDVWIVPPWEPSRDDESIVIDPGRAFGTGSHATTRLCLEVISGLDRGALLDVGCGSGVLAIAAARLGFAPVTAIDNDPVAIEVAERNAAANGVPLDLYRADATTDRLRRADVAVVNVTEQVVAAVAPRLQCRLLVSSGYYDSHRPALRGYRHVERRTLESWAADLHERE